MTNLVRLILMMILFTSCVDKDYVRYYYKDVHKVKEAVFNVNRFTFEEVLWREHTNADSIKILDKEYLSTTHPFGSMPRVYYSIKYEIWYKRIISKRYYTTLSKEQQLQYKPYTP